MRARAEKEKGALLGRFGGGIKKDNDGIAIIAG